MLGFVAATLFGVFFGSEGELLAEVQDAVFMYLIVGVHHCMRCRSFLRRPVAFVTVDSAATERTIFCICRREIPRYGQKCPLTDQSM